MNMTANSVLDEFLGYSIESLDISHAEYQAAVDRYVELGDYLIKYWGRSTVDGLIYPQGSMNLGTVTRIIHRNDEYDLDAVCLREYAPGSISQDDLKEEVGEGLERFCRTKPTDGPELDDEGRRCWTLLYPGQRFHLDVLPALPNPNNQPNGVVVTDTTRTQWLPSNPMDYGTWFRGLMATEYAERVAVFAKRMDVADVPLDTIKTTLQRSVQALKRHRDIYFAGRLDRRPPSIIITTLAGRAYRGGTSLYEVLRDITARMPDFIEIQNGKPVVSNPVQPAENFAERWAGDLTRTEEFFAWLSAAAQDLANLGADRGIDSILTKVASVFGDRPADTAAKRAGLNTSNSQRSGKLGIATGTGNLIIGAGRTSRPHSFRGDPR